MKKFTLLLASCMMVTWVAQSQEVARNMVVVEIGTTIATWNKYCPGAAMGADELLANGKSVAIIQNHNGDAYANTYSDSRNSYYGIYGYPTAIFDGGSKVVGGNSTVSMYPNYLAKYDAAIKIKSPVQIDYTVTRSGQQFVWDFVITKVLATLTSNQLVFQFVVTQSHIQQAWQGQTELNYVNRLMIPDQNGTALDFSTGDVQNVHIVANIDPLWPLKDIGFVGFVQDNANKKILNAMRPMNPTTVGMDEAEASNPFSVYPNPASKTLNISFNTGTPEVMKLKLINSLGNVVYTETLTTTGEVNHTINTGNLAEGMYFLNVQGKNLNYSQKVIVKH